MRIDPAGWPFVLGAVALACISGLIVGAAWAVPGVVLTAIFLFFFRDPERETHGPPGTVMSPADGRVMIAGAATGTNVPAGQWQQVSIFLSPMDVHVNRMPISGEVLRVEYHPGKFLPAYKREAGDLNEYTEIWVKHGLQTIVVRQIVGVLARRIVCRTRPGARVETGDRYGVMKFGSRMDVFLPVDATLKVSVGDMVVGGVTPLAELVLKETA